MDEPDPFDKPADIRQGPMTPGRLFMHISDPRVLQGGINVPCKEGLLWFYGRCDEQGRLYFLEGERIHETHVLTLTQIDYSY